MKRKSRSGGDAKLLNQKKVFTFLVNRFKSQATFRRSDIEAVTDWKGKSFDTYWSKQLKQFVVPVEGDSYRVSESFRPYAVWDEFQQHVTQVRRVSSDYKKTVYTHVLIYEFFMPLTNEGHLRTTLDALFYRDTIRARLHTLKKGDLATRFPRKNGEGEDEHLDRAAKWISEFFIGYSVSHVSGRFRAGEIASIAEVARIQEEGGRYLVDETTAIAKFIFPCADAEQARTVDWFFEELFIQSIIQVVNGEAEIWMVEGGLRTQLHRWQVED